MTPACRPDQASSSLNTFAMNVRSAPANSREGWRPSGARRPAARREAQQPGPHVAGMRLEIARSALCSMHFLMRTLGRERDGEGEAAESFDVLWETLSKRIDELNCAALGALDDAEVDLQGFAEIVFGEWTLIEEPAASAAMNQ